MRPFIVFLSSAVLVGANLVPSAIVTLGMSDGTLNALATDSSGNFYVAGGANNQVRVVKVSPTGNILYSTAFGGSTNDSPIGIAVDGSGAAYIAGSTYSVDFPIVNGYLTSGNMFLTKLSPDGSTIVYSTYIATSSTGQDQVRSVAVDAAGAAYVTGSATSAGFTTTPGAFMTSAPPYQDNVFVVKVAPDGSRPIWATFIAGNGIACATLTGLTCPISTPGFYFAAVERDTGWAIAVDGTGAVYVAGSTNSAGFPVTSGVVQTQYAGPTGTENQGFVTKLSADGSSLLYSTYLGNAQGEDLMRLAVDSQGNAIVGGTPRQVALTPKPGWPASPLPQFNGGFVVKLDPQAARLVYSIAVNTGVVSGIATGSDGTAYVTGGFADPLFPITPGGLPFGDHYFGSFVVLDASGSLVYSTTLPIGGTAGGAITAGSPASVAIGGEDVLTIFGPADPAQPAVYALANAARAKGPATYASGKVAPGELARLYGVNLGASPSVTFDGVQAPILDMQPNQVLIQVPFEIARRDTTSMQVYNGPQVLTLAVAPGDPAVFSQSGSGVTPPLNQDGTLNSENNPAQLGSIMTVFLTGAGPWLGGLGTGGIAPLAPLFSPLLPISVQVSSQTYQAPVHEATVLYAGSAPTQSDGIMQINFLLPAAPDLQLRSVAWVTVQVGTRQSPQMLIAVTK
jgi:uncharacterized protein (TIGR03437 family)